MQQKFESQSANMTDEQKQQLYLQMQQEMSQKQEEIQKGLQDKVDSAVSDVANTKSLSLVVDKRVVLYGGTDITEQVAKKLSGSSSQ